MTVLLAVVVLLGLIAVLGALFFLGMRQKWPFVLNAVRIASRAFKPVVLRSAGATGASASVVHHIGRRTGRHYETPVVAVPTPDGFAIALPYGLNTDWLKNVLARASAAIVVDGHCYEVDRPEIVPTASVDSYFQAKEQRLHRQFAVTTALLVRRAGVVAASEDTALRRGA